MDKKKKKKKTASSLFQNFPSSGNTRTVSRVSPPSLSLSPSSMAEEPLSPKPSLAATQRAPMASNRLQSPTSPFFLASNDDQLERAQARAARAAANRRIAASTTAPSPPPDSYLSKERIIDLYNNCIKLASENKINQKNTWELMLIDHLSEVIKVETENNAETNFQKASCTLEAGVKIYSARVDAVHSEAYKVLGGINRAGIEDEQETVADGGNADNELDGTHSKKNPERKISPLSTLESSFEVLNVKKFDVTFSVDPLYHQTSAKFDEGGAKGLLLNNLGVYGGCRVLFDSFEVPGKCKSCSSQNTTSDMVDLSFAKESIEQMVMNMRAMNEISPTLKDIVCLFDSDNQRPLQTFDVGQESDVIVDAYDDNKFYFDSNLFGSHDASISDHDYETSFVNQSCSSGDPAFQSHHEGNDPYTFREPDVDDTFEKFSMFLFQGLGVASKQNAWAGPDHWKYCRSKGSEDATTTEGGPTVSTKRAKKKILTEVDIEFKEPLDEEVHDIFLPPKNPKSLLLPANRAPANNRLPEDCHYQPEDLIKLFLLPNVLCLGKRRYFFGNNDFDEALPSWDNESVLDGQHDDGHFRNSADNLDRLVSQPRQVNRIEVQYDKTSKQVDVHSLKETLWEHIQESCEVPESQKVCKETISFRQLLSSFPVDCRAAAPEDISPHLCFICLLHLANEHGLNIRGSPSLDDLSIHLPSSCGNSDGGSSLQHNQDAT
ncbi:condensin complex subunit 2-like isoform X4 [Carya illinoinensis]|uniref:condensin complex subunit 2-like isoform X4 n=1 Tax=Carya illinoinensis TaxID=32201 RepID=UPI001C71F7AC|nr:condensin complex subunit 2-like isoform X4 [Carya illinoinensis]